MNWINTKDKEPDINKMVIGYRKLKNPGQGIIMVCVKIRGVHFPPHPPFPAMYWPDSEEWRLCRKNKEKYIVDKSRWGTMKPPDYWIEFPETNELPENLDIT